MVFLRQLSPDFIKTILGLIALLMALFVAIPFHEFAHAFVAKKQGDYTAAAYKRCTPAALVHFDVAGFLMMIFFGYGWARPVPVNKNNFKNGRRSQFWVSIAGILMNLILGTVFLFIYMLIYKIDSSFYFNSYYGYMLEIFLFFSFQMNFGLAIFNLLPIYPFDGYNIIDSMCRYDNAYLRFAKRYSTIILIIVIVFGIYDLCYSLLIEKIYDVLFSLFSKILRL
ncbi:MAG: site-2 protease family protein [Clostridia bacterium]|nr:site-2 protease family protein [Clostridia bacterium]